MRPFDRLAGFRGQSQMQPPGSGTAFVGSTPVQSNGAGISLSASGNASAQATAMVVVALAVIVVVAHIGLR